jgi:polar amino acid transport system permease protein
MVTLDFAAVLVDWPLLLRGVAATVVLTAISAVAGVAVGVVCGWARAWGPVGLARAVAVYVELVRNTPFIVQLFFIFFGLPSLGLRLSPEAASVIAMVVNLGAYAAEIVRAGIEATPRGQVEAGLSLALTRSFPFVRAAVGPGCRLRLRLGAQGVQW